VIPGFVELNEAYQTLRDPASRLRHFLELELGGKPDNVRTMPAELTAWFAEVGDLCRSVDAFLAEKRATNSPLVLVSIFRTGQIWVGRIENVQKRLTARVQALHGEVGILSQEWRGFGAGNFTGAARADLLARLGDMWQLLTYYKRWSAQLTERLVQLST
jgi:hypothetical protein